MNNIIFGGGTIIVHGWEANMPPISVERAGQLLGYIISDTPTGRKTLFNMFRDVFAEMKDDLGYAPTEETPITYQISALGTYRSAVLIATGKVIEPQYASGVKWKGK